jgi:serine/threonine protein kinase
LQPGDLIAGKYRLKQRIGAGGMGSVWAAHHEAIGRDVAIKITTERLAQHPEARERFRSEAMAVGRLQHPNVIDALDFGELDDGRCYIVFELLEGMSLDRYIETSRRLRPDEAVSIAIEVCRGLQGAHESGVVHRDLKPANVFLHAWGGGRSVKILDFGISQKREAHAGETPRRGGALLATPEYMSAEQARGDESIDPRTDVWGVGSLLYEMMTGRVPFEAPTYNAMMAKILGEEPPPLSQWGVDAPESLCVLVGRCLAKQPRDRYATAADLRVALEEVLLEMPSSLRWLPVESLSATSTGTRSTLPPAPDDEAFFCGDEGDAAPSAARRRAWWGPGPAAAAFVFLVLGAGLGFLFIPRPPHPAGAVPLAGGPAADVRGVDPPTEPPSTDSAAMLRSEASTAPPSPPALAAAKPAGRSSNRPSTRSPAATPTRPRPAKGVTRVDTAGF